MVATPGVRQGTPASCRQRAGTEPGVAGSLSRPTSGTQTVAALPLWQHSAGVELTARLTAATSPRFSAAGCRQRLVRAINPSPDRESAARVCRTPHHAKSTAAHGRRPYSLVRSIAGRCQRGWPQSPRASSATASGRFPRLPWAGRSLAAAPRHLGAVDVHQWRRLDFAIRVALSGGPQAVVSCRHRYTTLATTSVTPDTSAFSPQQGAAQCQAGRAV